MDHTVSLPRLLTDKDLAGMFSIALGTVRKWRLDGQGPRWIKIGGSVRYRPEDVSSYLADCTVGGSSPTAASNG